MAEIGGWSSGESEPEIEENVENEEIDDIDFEDNYDENEIFHDAYFYLSTKDFEGSSKINPNIYTSRSNPIDYLKYFFDSSLLQIIVDETNRYETQDNGKRYTHTKS